MPNNHHLKSFVLLFLFAIVISGGCSMPFSSAAKIDPLADGVLSPDEIEGFSEEDLNQPLFEEDNTDKPLWEEKDPLEDKDKHPPGIGDTRIEYNHLLTTKMMVGSIGLDIEIKVNDFVPLNYTATGVGPKRCAGETHEWPYFKATGEKELSVNGTAILFLGEETCDCSFTDSIDVSIEGFTYPVWGTQNCDEIMLALAFNETWYTNPNWVCDCDDQVKNVLGSMLENIPSGSPPGINDHTLQFNVHCPGQYREERMHGEGGGGTYSWTWRPGYDEGGGAVRTVTTYSGDETQAPDGAPSCLQIGQAQWGPPLSSIDNGVLEWFTEGYE